MQKSPTYVTDLRAAVKGPTIALMAATTALLVIQIIHMTTGAPRGLGFVFPVAVVLVARLVDFGAALWTAGFSAVAFAAFVVPHADNSIDVYGLTATLICMVVLAFIDAWRPAKPPRRGLAWLPFVSQDSDGKATFWDVPATGNYMADIEAGQAAARDCIYEMRAANSGYLLIWSIRDMVENGRFSGVEVGFMGTISRALIDDHADDFELKNGVVEGLNGVGPAPVGDEKAWSDEGAQDLDSIGSRGKNDDLPALNPRLGVEGLVNGDDGSGRV